ncbi:hypothetical protein [Sorangium atrum]|uniref:Uncharacterized protein n=1 Tax=Sorangium atrum TaxID=2995308 RepID=A0ABT5CF67_9BACT|nr:hypothetical protein [Sorangium aterium]MDC0685089.1 hypothetical protein [Sorangium aterium]
MVGAGSAATFGDSEAMGEGAGSAATFGAGRSAGSSCVPCAASTGRAATLPPHSAQRQAVELAPEGIGSAAFALAAGSYYAARLGEFRLADALTRRVREVTEPVAERDPVARGWLQIALAFHEAWRDGDLWTGLCMAEAARASFVQAGYWRGSIVG